MARRFKRRKPRVTWLPLLANKSGDGGGEGVDAVWGVKGYLNIPSTGGVAWDAFPVTFDYQDSAYQAQYNADAGFVTLRDIVEGNAYRLRRIVGKAFLSNYSRGINFRDVNDVWGTEAGVGFIICRTDENGDATTDFDECNPLIQESAEDPWIWHRRWLLGAGGQGPEIYDDVDAEQTQSLSFPATNAGYGSVADGPHVDQKTARIVSSQERLYCVVAGRINSPNGANATLSNLLNYNIATRLLASLRSNMGNRRNASR